jgi:hypothetical protein
MFHSLLPIDRRNLGLPHRHRSDAKPFMVEGMRDPLPSYSSLDIEQAEFQSEVRGMVADIGISFETAGRNLNRLCDRMAVRAAGELSGCSNLPRRPTASIKSFATSGMISARMKTFVSEMLYPTAPTHNRTKSLEILEKPLARMTSQDFRYLKRVANLGSTTVLETVILASLVKQSRIFNPQVGIPDLRPRTAATVTKPKVPNSPINPEPAKAGIAANAVTVEIPVGVNRGTAAEMIQRFARAIGNPNVRSSAKRALKRWDITLARPAQSARREP